MVTVDKEASFGLVNMGKTVNDEEAGAVYLLMITLDGIMLEPLAMSLVNVAISSSSWFDDCSDDSLGVSAEYGKMCRNNAKLGLAMLGSVECLEFDGWL